MRVDWMGFDWLGYRLDWIRHRCQSWGVGSRDPQILGWEVVGSQGDRRWVVNGSRKTLKTILHIKYVRKRLFRLFIRKRQK